MKKNYRVYKLNLYYMKLAYGQNQIFNKLPIGLRQILNTSLEGNLTLIKANFKISKTSKYDSQEKAKQIDNEAHDITPAEFEEFIIKAGAKGSFMIFRSAKKEDELGLEEL